MSLTDRLYNCGRNTACALTIATSLLSPNYSQAQPPTPRTSEAQMQVINHQARTREVAKQINALYLQYEQTLERKGKYDSAKKDGLRSQIYPVDIDLGKRLESMERTLLIEQDPDKYLHQYIKSREEIEKIKAITLTTEEKRDYKERVFGYVKFDPDKLDLSDKINIYLNRKGKLRKTISESEKETAEDISKGIVNPMMDLFGRFFKR